MVKIGNTSFREEVIKKMNFKEFKEIYTPVLKGQDLKKVYEEVTGTAKEDPKEVIGDVLG